jgi:uncharacterized metal-binding protein YceD (DUF177 family)
VNAPELSRPIRIDSIGEAPRTLSIEADEAERAALARRFGYVGLDRLAADVSLSRRGEAITARGTLRASLAQSCVATGEAVPEEVEESFSIEFRPQPRVGDEEIELGEGELDVVFYDSATVDVGEAVAETLSLAVDLWPRAAGAEDALRKAGVKSEEEAGPFGALAALRDKLKP